MNYQSEDTHGPYFKVQWFCLISWRLFDVWTSYFGIMSQYDTTCDLKINVTVTYISWSSDFASYLEDCLMYVHHTSGLWVSMTPFIFCSENILVLLAKHNSGKLCCPATALNYSAGCLIILWISLTKCLSAVDRNQTRLWRGRMWGLHSNGLQIWPGQEKNHVSFLCIWSIRYSLVMHIAYCKIYLSQHSILLCDI